MNKHPPLLGWHVDAPHSTAALGDFSLESGDVIRDCVQTYALHGTLNAAKSNAVLVLPAITSSHHRLDFLIGAGRALDPSKWFVIAVDAIGNGLATSPSNSTHQPAMRFPRFGIRDMVDAQYRALTEHLGLPRVHAIVGASMGGMQALQWAVSHPGFAEKIVAMTPMARTSSWSIAVNEAARSCLMADAAWTGDGFSRYPEAGWNAYVALHQALLSRTPQAALEEFPEGKEILPWIAERRRAWIDAGFDAHDYLYQSWAYDAHDVGATRDFGGFDGFGGFGGDWRRALASVQASTLVLTPPLDLYNPVECGAAAAAAMPHAQHVIIRSVQGHQAANVASEADIAFVNSEIAAFLRR